jgi:hypothetical protein
MTTRSWIRKLFGAQAPPPVPATGRGRNRGVNNRARLALEALEDRLAPASFTVVNLSDADPGSLRQAVLGADVSPGASTINFRPGLTGTINLASGELLVTAADLTVTGPGASNLTVSGNHASRVFEIAHGTTASLSGLSISGGASDFGAGILNGGALTVSNSTLSGNSASNAGGGITNVGTVTVSNSTLAGNSAGVDGGGIANFFAGTVTVGNSTLAGNSTGGNGGGIANSGGTVTVSTSTLSGNSAAGDGGGGIYNVGTVTVSTSTLSGNSATGGSGVTLFSGGGIYNVGTVTVSNSTLSGNSATGGSGGGISNRGTLTVSTSTLSGNSATGGSGVTLVSGGGIYNVGTVTVSNSTLSGNSAVFGGGIENSGAVTVSNSTLSGNSALEEGGGIDIFLVGTVTVGNSTLSGNSSAGYGGGIYNADTVTVGNSTLSGNSSGQGGGGIYNGWKVTVGNTVLAGNTDFLGGPDLFGSVTSQGHNLIGNISGVSGGSGWATSDLQNFDPLLGPLQNNGGPTQTMALLPGSRAIDAGDNNLVPAGVTTDQRGPGFNRIVDGTVDIGAFEVQPPTVSVTASVSAPVYGQAVTVTAALSYLGSPVTAGAVTFQEGTTVLASGVALNSSGQATYTTSSLSAAAHTLRAVYSGSPGFFASSGSTSLTIAPAPLSVTAADAGRAYGVANPALTGSVVGLQNNDPITAAYTTPAAPASPPGRYPIVPALSDGGTGRLANYTVTANNGTLTVTPAPLSATGVNVSATAGAPFSGAVATFPNADPFGNAASYRAVITWGDGSTSAGTITGTGGTLTVSGTHTYADPGSEAVGVQISHNLGYTTTATANSTATVSSLGLGVQAGLAGSIGFWQSPNGQALINSFNGGSTSTALSAWLATNFANLYGAGAGANDLTGQTNAQVAAFYQSQFALGGTKVEAQVLATALNVYATTASLGGPAGTAYGFTVSATGLGARSYNVGADGAAFGVANGTTRNVYQLLRAVDQRAAHGVLYNGDLTLRQQAADLFDALNQAGGIDA